MKQINFNSLYTPTLKQRELQAAIGKKSRILYGGARGGGKTSAAVWLAVRESLRFPGLRTAVVRRSYRQLIAQCVRGELLKRYPENLGIYRYYRTDKLAEFKNGSIIFFVSLQHPDDVEKEQGIERGFYILDEGNQLQWETIQKLTGSLRSTGIPGWKDTLLITGNPGGECDNELKYRWIEPDYSRWNEDELKIKDEFLYIPSKVMDNPHVDQSYQMYLRSLPEHLRQAWLEGDWSVKSGQFFEEWEEKIHVIEPFTIPDNWVKWRAVDLGYGSHESVCLWLTQDPETGTLYVYRELGTRDVTEELIKSILRESGDEQYVMTFLDPAMWATKKETLTQMSPANMFILANIFVQRADNNRETGWRNLKQWIHWTPDRPPMLKVFKTCRGLIETLPIQQYVPNKMDLNTKARDDYADALRYATSHIVYGYKMTPYGAYDKMESQKPPLGEPINGGIYNARAPYAKQNDMVRSTTKNYYRIPREGTVTSVYSLF